jgi:hypothetical protein
VAAAHTGPRGVAMVVPREATVLPIVIMAWVAGNAREAVTANLPVGMAEAPWAFRVVLTMAAVARVPALWEAVILAAAVALLAGDSTATPAPQATDHSAARSSRVATAAAAVTARRIAAVRLMEEAAQWAAVAAMAHLRDMEAPTMVHRAIAPVLQAEIEIEIETETETEEVRARLPGTETEANTTDKK